MSSGSSERSNLGQRSVQGAVDDDAVDGVGKGGGKGVDKAGSACGECHCHYCDSGVKTPD